jgi:hypothetical protein
MTEEEWNSSPDPQVMLGWLRDQGMLSDRKARLFAVACCRRIWPLLLKAQSRMAVEVLEEYIEGVIGSEGLAIAARVAHIAPKYQAPTDNGWAIAAAATAVAAYVPPEHRDPWEAPIRCAKYTALGAVWALGNAADPDGPGDRRYAATKREEAKLCQILRCIFPNPFLPPPRIELGWLLWNDGIVGRLAEAAYQERQLPSGHLDPARLAVLADALEDAGCAEPTLLSHCRDGGAVHVRGCFVLDLLLGKE